MTTRRPKPAQNAWLIEQRKRRGWKPEDVADRLDVSVATVRGWESGRGIGPDSMTRLEALFGVAAPGHEQPTSDAAMLELADAIRDLVEELRLSRAGQVEATAVAFQALGALGAGVRGPAGTQNGSEHEDRVGTGR